MLKKENIENDTNCFLPPNDQIALEWLAVLSSQNIPYQVEKEDSSWRVWVPPDEFDVARAQLDEFESEKAFFPPKEPPGSKAPPLTLEMCLPALSGILPLIVFYCFTGPYSNSIPVFSQGVMSENLILHGEWWRCLTALTLHSDATHLISNMLFMFIFSLSLSQTLGGGTAWALILLGGAIGNCATYVFEQVFPCDSLGSSTAVFAALGIIGAYRFLDKLTNPPFTRPWIIAVVIIGLLGLTGGGPGTDILAHFCGFLSGSLLGLLGFIFKVAKFRENPYIQYSLAFFIVILIFVAWLSAATNLS